MSTRLKCSIVVLVLSLLPVLDREVCAGTLVGPVVISEFMASNDLTLADEDGHFSDWIEVQSVTSETVNLR